MCTPDYNGIRLELSVRLQTIANFISALLDVLCSDHVVQLWLLVISGVVLREKQLD